VVGFLYMRNRTFSCQLLSQRLGRELLRPPCQMIESGIEKSALNYSSYAVRMSFFSLRLEVFVNQLHNAKKIDEVDIDSQNHLH